MSQGSINSGPEKNSIERKILQGININNGNTATVKVLQIPVQEIIEAHTSLRTVVFG